MKLTGSSSRALWLVGALVPYGLLFASQTATPSKVSYGRDVQPILKAHCISCHTGAAAAAGLDLSDFKAMAKGGDSGPAFLAGKPDASILLQRILGKGNLPRMPKGQAPLSDDEISTLKLWIAQGPKQDSVIAKHWAYVAPVKPPVPKLGSSWVRNPIDAFVLTKLKEGGLHPSTEASKETLLRRVSLDLTGLPPTPRDIDAFLADKSANAYEKVVDRLLNTPAYGERQARGWLDLARYADSDGFEKDLTRTAWKYRDWVIDSFNRNLPYDQFVIQQIGGDLLPGATLDQKIATGFNRNTMFNREGGVDQEEAHFAVVLDRVDTTSTVFLGSTLGCAKCHDHKYDPFTQRDYYKMAAFFSNTVILPRGPKDVGEEKWFEPEIPAPSAEQAAEQTRLKIEIAELNRQYTAWSPTLDADYEHWKKNIQAPADFSTASFASMASREGATLTVQSDGSVLVSGKMPDNDVTTLSSAGSPNRISGFRLDVIPDPSLGSGGPGRAGNGNFVLTGLKIEANGVPVSVADVAADFSQVSFDPKRILASDTRSGWAIGGQLAKKHSLLIALGSPISAGSPFSVTLEQLSPYGGHLLGRFKISTTSVADPITSLVSDRIRLLAAKPNRDDADEQELKAAFRQSSRTLSPVRERLAVEQAKLTSVSAAIPTAMVLEEKRTAEPPSAYIHHRGEFLSKTELVVAGTPAVLPPLPSGRPDRLALGRWLTSRNNPLTARVEVNRIWEQYFGRGIVETCEDFGAKGSRPTHPELLDWLAVQFMDSGWNLKALHKLIVMSATYRQSSAATPSLMAKDPQNLLLARGPRFRMEAEMIHDTALAVSGLLTHKVGGPSVMPLQPDGIWDSPYSGEQWRLSMAGDRYRRGIYTFLKRTAPYPSFMALDSTSRESCTVRRIRTNTPLQALALLNDQLMLEAARALGGEMMSAAKDDSARLTDGFRLCTSRKPEPKELNRLKGLLARLENRYSGDPKAAERLGGSPTAAAYTMVGNVLLNLDETITKG